MIASLRALLNGSLINKRAVRRATLAATLALAGVGFALRLFAGDVQAPADDSSLPRAFLYGEFGPDGKIKPYRLGEIRDRLKLEGADLEKAFLQKLSSRYSELGSLYSSVKCDSESSVRHALGVRGDVKEALSCQNAHITQSDVSSATCASILADFSRADLLALRKGFLSSDQSWTLFGAPIHDGDKLVFPYLSKLRLHRLTGDEKLSVSSSYVIQRYEHGVRTLVATASVQGDQLLVKRLTFSHPNKPTLAYEEDGHVKSAGLTGFGLLQPTERLEDLKHEAVILYSGFDFLAVDADTPCDLAHSPAGVSRFIGEYFDSLKTALLRLDQAFAKLPRPALTVSRSKVKS